MYCNLAKPHPLGVYIVYERLSLVLSFVSLYFAVAYSDRAALNLPVLLRPAGIAFLQDVPTKVSAVSYIFTAVTVSN